MDNLVEHYSARDIEARLLEAISRAGLNPAERLSPAELGALDHFHTGGIQASLELLDLARIGAGDRVLDIGAGLGGSARMIAFERDCRVDCVELSADYCAGAVLLNRLTGLDDRIDVHQASALDLPFADDSFDAVWMQNVGMNIADKGRLYAEIGRVLKPGGRYAFQEMAAGSIDVTYFPLPWATVPLDNFLVSSDAMCLLMAESGLVAEIFEDVSDDHLKRAGEGGGAASLSLSVFVDNLAQKAGNARRSLEEGQVRLVRGVFRAP